MEQENDNAEANYIMNLLRRLVKETNCAIVLIHHTPKSDDSKGVYRGRGASAIAGAVDIVVNLEALDDEIIKLTVGKNRVIGTNPVLYIKKAGEDTFEPYTPQGESSGFEMFKAQEFLLSLSPDREWQTGEIIKIGKEKGFNERTIERVLKRLVEAGKYQRLKKGIYRIRQTDNSAIHRDSGCGGMAESNPSPDQISQWRLSQLAKRNMAIQIYSELLGCSFWLCSNETMALQIKEDDPEAITYTAEEMRELIRLNPTPEDIRCIHNVKTVFNGSRMAEKE